MCELTDLPYITAALTLVFPSPSQLNLTQEQQLLRAAYCCYDMTGIEASLDAVLWV